jgi:hypothetical protein
MHVSFLSFLEESSIPKFKISSFSNFIVVFVCKFANMHKFAGLHLNVTSHLTPSCLLLLPWSDAKFEAGIDREEFLELWDFPF